MSIYGICEKCGNETKDYICSSCIIDEINSMKIENERLLRGEFTPEELQNLCHNLPEEKKEEFFNGCCEYQKKLFGKSAVDEEMERCIKIVQSKEPWISKKWAQTIENEIRQR